MSSAALRAARSDLQRSLAEADAILAELHVPYDRLSTAYWAADARCVATTRPGVIQHDAAAKAARLVLYDARWAASARLSPVKTRFRETTAWRKAVVQELDRVNADLAALPTPRVVRLGGPSRDPFERAMAAWMASRKLTARPPAARP